MPEASSSAASLPQTRAARDPARAEDGEAEDEEDEGADERRHRGAVIGGGNDARDRGWG
jgi:hypothetical protein